MTKLKGIGTWMSKTQVCENPCYLDFAHPLRVLPAMQPRHPGEVVRISDSMDMISTDLLGKFHENGISMNRVITFSTAHQRVRASLAVGLDETASWQQNIWALGLL